MKVFRMNDYDWWAAETLDEAKKDYRTELDYDFCDARELSEEEMTNLIFVDEDGNNESFREHLQRLISNKAEFPRFFASTEY